MSVFTKNDNGALVVSSDQRLESSQLKYFFSSSGVSTHLITVESKVKCRFCEDLGTILTNINLEADDRQYVSPLGRPGNLHEPDINTHGKQATDADCHKHSVILAGVGLLTSVRLGPQLQPDHCNKSLTYLIILVQ